MFSHLFRSRSRAQEQEQEQEQEQPTLDAITASLNALRRRVRSINHTLSHAQRPLSTPLPSPRFSSSPAHTRLRHRLQSLRDDLASVFERITENAERTEHAVEKYEIAYALDMHGYRRRARETGEVMGLRMWRPFQVVCLEGPQVRALASRVRIEAWECDQMLERALRRVAVEDYYADGAE